MQIRQSTLGQLLFGLLILASLPHCRAGKSGVQNEDGLKSSSEVFVPRNVIWRELDPRKVADVFLPATQFSGRLAKMNGVWYCKSPKHPFGLSTGTVVFDLKNAYTVDDTIVFGVYEPLVYGNSPDAAQFSHMTNGQELPSWPLSYGQIKFSSDTHADLLFYSYVAGRGLVAQDPNQAVLVFTMDEVAPGHFVRHSTIKGVVQDDYDFLQIIDADGHQTDAFQTYLTDSQSTTRPLGIFVPKGSPMATDTQLKTTDQSIATSPEYAGGGIPVLYAK